MRKSAERVEAGLLIHLLSEAETQLWMHKRPWPEGKAKASSALQYTIDGWPLSSGQFWALLAVLIVSALMQLQTTDFFIYLQLLEQQPFYRHCQLLLL